MAVVHRFRPLVTKGNETFDTLYDIQSDESKKVNDDSKQVFDNTFIKTADLEGIKRFEKIYNISSDSSKSTEERRDIIYNWMIYKPPFTRQRLRSLLRNVIGDDNFQYVIDAENFMIIVSIPMVDRNVYNDYIKKIREIIPANLLLILSTPYTYLYLTSMTYGDSESVEDLNDETKLCHYTYRELSKYSIFDKTLEIPLALNGSTDGTSVPNVGEIVDLAGAGIAYVCEI